MLHFETMETRVVARLQKLFPGKGQIVANSDDAAVIATSPRTAITVDTQQENIHFRWTWAPPEALGRRFVAVVLSDLAAMGARPRAGVLSLVIPRGLPEKRLWSFIDGVAECAATESFRIVGGDVTRGAAFGASLTALGDAPPKPLRRFARKGDYLCVSGPIGGAAWERAQLLAGKKIRSRAWLFPPSRIVMGGKLARMAGVHGAMDISDGLFLDARRMATAAGLGLRMFADALPVHPAVRKLSKTLSLNAWLALVGGGEDYELLVSCAADQIPHGLVAVGRFSNNGFDVEISGRQVSWPKAGYLHK